MRTRERKSRSTTSRIGRFLYKYRKPLYSAAKKYTPAIMHQVGLGKHTGKVQKGFQLVDTGLALRKRIKSQM